MYLSPRDHGKENARRSDGEGDAFFRRSGDDTSLDGATMPTPSWQDLERDWYKKIDPRNEAIPATIGDFAASLATSLDFETSIKRVGQYLANKIPCTNLGIYFPDDTGDYVLGGFADYEDVHEATFKSLADVVAAKSSCVVRRAEPIVFADLYEAAEAFSGVDNWLTDKALCIANCNYQQENRAVIVLFRDENRPFSPVEVNHVRQVLQVIAKQFDKIAYFSKPRIPPDDLESGVF